MDAGLLAMLTDTIQVAPQTTPNTYGEEAYGPAVPRKARIQKTLVTAFMATGRQIVEETKVFVESGFVMRATDHVTLPDGSTPPIQGFAPKHDEQGILTHYEVLF